jgi:DNA modification methylase
LVSRLLLDYSKPGDLVLDPFGGCGTTLVEAKLNGRNSICTDVDESALLISTAKAIAIKPKKLEVGNTALLKRISNSQDNKNYYTNANSRLKYWFKQEQFNKLTVIFNEIHKEQDRQLLTFYECCFSNILKNCSTWFSKSIKPQKDLKKKIADPLSTFVKHLNFMTAQNLDYYNRLEKSQNQKIKCKVKKADARKTGLRKNSIDLIITSPPYAISYEYADIHQLSLLWFNFTNNIAETRKEYIGTSFKKMDIEKENIPSAVGLKTVIDLEKYDKGLAKQIANYIVDLNLSFREMKRVLKHGKSACIIIGDTEYRGVRIRNTEISTELLNNMGFRIKKVIKRRISSKNFTPYRDPNGKFSNDKNGKMRKIYKYEYIVIAKNS